MKFIFLVGGFTGFATAAFVSWISDHAPERVFLDATLGCLAGAWLFRWFWRVVLGAMRETVVNRHRATAAAQTLKPHD
ncbi:MAG TPA: hypothetical protein VMM36_09770 [Opitutaceae bacterium]|nr:hypothetical protein [Opitutaceae bacterium]